MALKPQAKKALIFGGLAVAAYLIYRWYMNKQAAANSGNGLGTNLGSAAASTLTSLSAGPSTELNYYGSGANNTAQSSTPITTQQSSSTSVTGTDSGSGTSSNQTASAIQGQQIVGWDNVLAAAGNNYSGASPASFLQAFRATGQNAGTIVPGGTGQPIPLQPGQSYTS